MERVEPRNPGTRPVPHVLLVVLGQLVDDLRFLRRLVAFGRKHLIHSLTPEPRGSRSNAATHRASMDCLVHGQPTISCRMYSRPMLNWQHVFRSLFPKKFSTMPSLESSSAPVVQYCSRLVYGA